MRQRLGGHPAASQGQPTALVEVSSGAVTVCEWKEGTFGCISMVMTCGRTGVSGHPEGAGSFSCERPR